MSHPDGNATDVPVFHPVFHPSLVASAVCVSPLDEGNSGLSVKCIQLVGFVTCCVCLFFVTTLTHFFYTSSMCNLLHVSGIFCSFFTFTAQWPATSGPCFSSRLSGDCVQTLRCLPGFSGCWASPFIATVYNLSVTDIETDPLNVDDIRMINECTCAHALRRSVRIPALPMMLSKQTNKRATI